MSRLRQDAVSRDPWSVVYAAEGTDGFNARLHGVLRDMTRDTLSAVGDPLVAVAVTGAFGVGRGRCVPFDGGRGRGIWSHGQAPGDDVEILVVANADRAVVRRLLQPVSQKYAAILNVEVRFTRVIAENDLRQMRPSLDWYEIVQSHRLLFGTETVFAGLRARLGLQEDGCAEPILAPDEADWQLLRGAFLAMPHLAGSPGMPDRLFFSLVRHLGDALMLHQGHWMPEQAERDARVLHLLSEDAWFRSHATDALEFHELYREAVSFFSDEPSPAIGLDWLSYIRCWLLVDDFLAADRDPGAPRNPRSHGLWRRFLRRRLARAALDWPEIGRPERSWLFRFLGGWYYRGH